MYDELVKSLLQCAEGSCAGCKITFINGLIRNYSE